MIRLAISVGGLFTYWTRFGSKPKSLNVASRELADQQVDANAIPVMALSISERELLGADIFPVGHLGRSGLRVTVRLPLACDSDSPPGQRSEEVVNGPGTDALLSRS